MSQNQQVSFFNFDNLEDNDREYLEVILSTRVNQTSGVELPWKEEEIVRHEACDHNPFDVVVSNQHIHYVNTSSAVAPSQCIDIGAVSVAGTTYFPHPLYVLAHVPPNASLMYPGPGMTTANMIGSPVLTTAGYMAHMIPPQMMLPLQPPTHAGGMMLPGIMEQAPGVRIVVPGPMLPHAATEYLPHAPLGVGSVKPVVDGQPVSGYLDQPSFNTPHVTSETPLFVAGIDVGGKVQYGFQAPVTSIADGNGHIIKHPMVNHCPPGNHLSAMSTAVSQGNHFPYEIESSELGVQFLNASDIDHLVITDVQPSHQADQDSTVSQVIESTTNECVNVPSVDTGVSVSGNDISVANFTGSNHSGEDSSDFQHEIRLDSSEDKAAVPDMSEGVQWPSIGQSSPLATASIAVPPKAKGTWASLLKDTASATNAIIITSSDQQGLLNHKFSDTKNLHGKGIDLGENLTRALSCIEAEKQKIGELLKVHKLSHRSVHIQPRGLTNRGNWCYVNATLQALLACPPFYHLLKLLPPLDTMLTDDKSLAVMRSMVEFVNNFSEKSVKSFEKQNENTKGNIRQEIRSGAPFEPIQVYKMLQAIDYQAFKHGQQEDAEEFLSCILNRLHDEMVSVMKLVDNDKSMPIMNGGDAGPVTEVARGSAIANNIDAEDATTSGDSNENRWEQVRSRNRTVFNTVADNESSPISAIFRGQICSILHQLGQKESATLQSFFTLQLDVQNDNVKSVKDALEQLVSKECLQGYTCTKSKVEVDATQRMLLEELPPVLVLQLKWFIYDKNGGMQKYVKQVDFDIDLEINKELLSSHAKAKCPTSHRKYKLFAVVNHIGARAVGGHYTVDVFHAGYNCWVHCDDNQVTSMPTASVTKFTAPKVPYLIFYRRLEPS